MRWDRKVTGALPSGIEVSKGIKEQEPKSVFEVENTSGNSQSTLRSCSMAEGVHPGSCKSNGISRNSRAQTHKNEELWSRFNRSNSAGEGDVTTEAASPVAGELVAAETWRSAVSPGWGSAAWSPCYKAFSGTRKSGAWAIPTRSPGSRSATPVKGSTCRPEATKFSCIAKRPGCGSMSSRYCPVSAGSHYCAPS